MLDKDLTLIGVFLYGIFTKHIYKYNSIVYIYNVGASIACPCNVGAPFAGMPVACHTTVP